MPKSQLYEFDPIHSIFWHSGIWGATDDRVLIEVQKYSFYSLKLSMLSTASGPKQDCGKIIIFYIVYGSNFYKKIL